MQGIEGAIISKGGTHYRHCVANVPASSPLDTTPYVPSSVYLTSLTVSTCTWKQSNTDGCRCLGMKLEMFNSDTFPLKEQPSNETAVLQWKCVGIEQSHSDPIPTGFELLLRCWSILIPECCLDSFAGQHLLSVCSMEQYLDTRSKNDIK